MEIVEIIVIASAGHAPEKVVTAACRADAMGCLVIDHPDAVGKALERLDFTARYSDQPVALLLSSVTPSDLATLLDRDGNPEVRLILGAEETGERLEVWSRFFEKEGRTFSAQVTNCEDGLAAAKAGAHCIILKGSESGGCVGDMTAFVLAQKWRKIADEQSLEVPFLVQGGIGIDTAAAVVAAGARGVVLDSQLLLARESSLDPAVQKWIKSADGSEVSNVHGWNFFHRPNSATIEKLRSAPCTVDDRTGYREILSEAEGDCFPFGQDICLAAGLADQFVTVGGIIEGIRAGVNYRLAAAARLQHLGPDSDFAIGHGIKYPILQGPMTRVSDTTEFAHAVSSNGALSFLALAVMRKSEAEKLLQKAQTHLKGMSWGVGVLGFLPAAIRAEQTGVILKNKPPFAIIAGGRPDQAKEFEDEGIATYLHVPSPGLLRNFLRQGARRFIFEGRECGGHVGPRSSFVLWQSICEIVLEQCEKKPIKDLHLVFAGGIHDDVSSAMIAAMTAPLAEKGVKIGLLMGTAYLFTKEAVESGAIVPRFQKEAVDCEETVLLQTGPGHAIRCVKTPYCDTFEVEKIRLEKEGATHEDIVRNLEGMNIGRLRVASKGLDRKKTENSTARQLVKVPETEQYDRGMYMIGQIAALEDEVISMADLHDRVCNGGVARLKTFAKTPAKVIREQKPSEIAIIGMSCYYPDAASLDEYWENILHQHSAIREVPKTHWDWRLYFDEDPKAKDRIVSKWGGFVKDILFDPMRYGITPKSMEAIEPLQLLALEAVNQALIDAGYEKRPFNRERTACIVGIGGGAGPKSVAYGFRTCIRLADFFEDMPIMSDEIIAKAGDVLPEWTEDSFPGFLSNICSGRVSNRFDLGGTNYAIDAACASSLASLDACVRELEFGNADMAIAMGADAVQTPLSYVAFSKTHALSRKGKSRPFDAEGDGIVLSEGVGVVVLKRLEDAEKAGDRIYAVIKGIGSSSDGKALGLTAPNAVGQARALERAYAKANIHPSNVDLIEAHGTGTVVGDRTEATALSTVLRESGAARQSCALGSVKSMIGHTKCAAGIAGLIKTAKALHHKVVPPTLVETPNPTANFNESALYLNRTARPWIHDTGSPRIAGVSAFGFGGTNYHTVLSEYTASFSGNVEAAAREWPTELFVWRGEKSEIIEATEQLAAQLKKSEADFHLGELADAVNRKAKNGPGTLAIIAKDKADLTAKLKSAGEKLKKTDLFEDPTGIIYRRHEADAKPKIGFLFSGQGSQYPDMLADLAVNFPLVRESFDLASTVVGDRIPRSLGQYIYPPSAFTPEEENQNVTDLAQTEIAQPALGACGVSITCLLAEFGITAEAFAGHSYGEFVAMHASGAISEAQLYEISFLRGRAIRDNLQGGSAMLAIKADAKTVRTLLSTEQDIYIANINSPTQTVVSLAESTLSGFQEKLTAQGVDSKRIPVACGFHSPFVEKASLQLEKALDQLEIGKGAGESVYSNNTGSRYPDQAKEQKSLLSNHLIGTVDFLGMVRGMRRDGINLFVEIGPGSVLTGLCNEIFEGATDVHTFSTDRKGRHGVTQLQYLIGHFLTLGFDPDTGYFSRIRHLQTRTVDKILHPGEGGGKSHMWIVNGVRSKRFGQPEPLLLGQPHPSIEKSGKKEGILQLRSTPKTRPNSSEISSMKNANSRPVAVQPEYANGSSNGTNPPISFQQTSGSDQAMIGFQNLMSQFLETQRSVMNAYLSGGSAPQTLPKQPVNPQIQPNLPPVESNGNRQPDTSLFETKRSLQAQSSRSNGAPKRLDSVKLDPTVRAPEPAPAEALPAEVSLADIVNHLFEIVGERTGYPREMLDVDLDLEADLGIDSIKRIEILGELAEFIMPDSTNIGGEGNLDIEKLSSLRTLQQILDYLGEFLESSREELVAASGAKKKVKV